jgi:cytidine deaminase
MPIIQRDYISSNAENRKDLVLRITARDTGRSFDFHVRRNRVEVECTNPITVKPDEKAVNDWRVSLTEAEKLRVFALVLDEYRKHSIGDEHGYRGAVLGISTRGDIFLGANTATEQVTSPYMKECAEQNMVSAASDLVAYEQVKKEGWDTANRPKAPKFESLYMMGGVDGGRVPVSCPCGMCTDMLAKNMTADAKVYALPILNDQTRDYLNSNAAPYVREIKPDPHLVAKRIQRGEAPPAAKTKLVRTPAAVVSPAEFAIDRGLTLAHVRGQVSDADGMARTGALIPYPVWQTTIQHLNAERTIDLRQGHADIAKMQSRAYTKLCADAHRITSLREEKLAEQHRRAVQKNTATPDGSSWDLFENVVGDVFSSVRTLSKKVRNLVGFSEWMNPVAMAAANQFVGRRSIAELDAAAASESNSIAAINEFMLSEMRHTLADRVLNDEVTANAGKSVIRRNIPYVRCVVLQLYDGTFHHAIECAGKYDASLPNAEASAVVQALPSLGRSNIRDVWVMEMNGQAELSGKMPTSPKEGVERIIKRGSPNLKFHFIPLNEGGYDAATVDKFTFHRDADQVMPALFKGSRPLADKHVRPQRAWTEFLNRQPANTHGSTLAL